MEAKKRQANQGATRLACNDHDDDSISSNECGDSVDNDYHDDESVCTDCRCAEEEDTRYYSGDCCN